MTRCLHCGFEEQDATAKFCKYCGTPINLSNKLIKVQSRAELDNIVSNYIECAKDHRIYNIDLNNIDVSEIKDLSYLFSHKEFLGSIDVSHWNVSKVEKMDSLFSYSVIDVDLSAWDVSNVTSMDELFKDSSF